MAKKQVVPYQNKKITKKTQVRQMFDGISPQYDLMNRIISGGIDVKWRKNVVAILVAQKPQKILDVATGTGDLAVALIKTQATEIIGIDISAGMLDLGKQKVKKNHWEKTIKMEIGDSENIDYADNYFDAVTVAFGVRNFENLDKGLSEILRVLRPGGDLVVLETAVPQNYLMRQFYRFYTQFIMPAIGWVFSKDKSAYQYLSDSAAAFPFGKAFNNILAKNGFIAIEDIPQTLGVASIYRAQKPMP
jgi:demethylmenaquinone methyltransferase/2-methoxy-6-polyprenyl-1,4-benzoquinol methylase